MKAVAALQKLNSNMQGAFSPSELNPVKIYDRNGILIGQFLRKKFNLVTPDSLHEYNNLTWAILSAEDRRFYEHYGLDFHATLRAIGKNLMQFRLTQGGSTITQQLAKLILNFPERSLKNKIAITFFAFYIENNFDKRTILSMYMNTVFLGEGNYGFEEASIRYFNKRANQLKVTEAALLAGVIPAPSLYNPIKNLKIALHKQQIVLEKMSQNKALCKSVNCASGVFNAKESLSEFRNSYNVKDLKNSNGIYSTSDIGKFFKSREYKVNLAPQFNDSIRKMLSDKFQNDELETLGLKVITTLDYEKQIAAERNLRIGLEKVKHAIQKKILKRPNQTFDLNLVNGLSGIFVSVNPKNGEIEIFTNQNIHSSRDGINRIEDIRRQPGSSIKGLIYALALEKKIITPSSILVDEKINIGGYSPKNWYKGYQGEITARKAFAQSVNTISVKLLQKIGVDAFLTRLAQILSKPEGEIFSRFSPNLTLALGSGELTPMELAVIYATIAGGGLKITPKKILKIIDRKNNVLLNNSSPDIRERILDPVACAMAINLMEAVMNDGGTMNIHASDELKLPIAGKTGTVQIPQEIKKKWGSISGIRDSWFAGVVPSTVSVVWVGNDFGAPIPSTRRSLSGTVWFNTILRIKNKLEFEKELIPLFEGNFIRVDICQDNEKLDTPEFPCKKILREQFYFKGSEPKFNHLKPEPEKPSEIFEENPLLNEEDTDRNSTIESSLDQNTD